MHNTSTSPASPIRDSKLTARARGVWATLTDMAGPSLEVPSALDRLRGELPDGQQAIRSALELLEKRGYDLKRTQRDARSEIEGSPRQHNPPSASIPTTVVSNTPPRLT